EIIACGPQRGTCDKRRLRTSGGCRAKKYRRNQGSDLQTTAESICRLSHCVSLYAVHNFNLSFGDRAQPGAAGPFRLKPASDDAWSIGGQNPCSAIECPRVLIRAGLA